MPPTSRRAEAGLTLLEVLAVVAILALIAAAAPRLGGGPPDGRDAARALVAGLSATRTHAIRTGGPADLSFAEDGAGWAAPTAEAEWPDGIAATLTTAAELAGAGGTSVIRFYADGSASGGEVALTGDGWTRRVRVHWLTGRVSADEE